MAKASPTQINAIPSEAEVFRSIVDSLFPVQEVHLIIGYSGAGKSRWLLRMLETWRKGESVYGHKSYPCPFVYISCDRSYRGVLRTFYKIGLNPHEWNIVGHDDKETPESIREITNRALKRFPATKLLVIEGLGSLAGKGNDYGNIAKFIKGLAVMCKKQDLTIIATHHTAKRKKEDMYQLSREKALGSASWGAYTETIISFDPKDPDNDLDPGRVISFIPRNDKPEQFYAEFNAQGLLVRVASPVEQAKVTNGAFREFLASLSDDNQEFSTQDVNTFFARRKPPLTAVTAKRAIKTALDDECIEKRSHGKYRKHNLDPIEAIHHTPEATE